MTADARPTVVIAPFANERMRDWPSAHFRRFIELVLATGPARILLVGVRSQRVRANEIVRGFPSTEVVNACGKMSWNELVLNIDRAAYVVANNSGVAHLASTRGRWTLCLFAGSHSPVEWMPKGQRAVVMMRATACAPCEIGGDRCPNGRACMTWLAPETAFAIFRRHMAARAEA